MKHSIHKFLSCLLLILIVRPVNAAENNATKSQISSLSDLEKHLEQTVSAEYPNTKVSHQSGNAVIFDFSDKFKTHIADKYGRLSEASTKLFPPDFSEFSLTIFTYPDIMCYRPKAVSNSEIPQPFGATFTGSYILKNLPYGLGPGADINVEIPFGNWAYKQYDTLFQAGLVPNRWPAMYMGAMGILTRWEFVVAIAHLTDNPSKEVQDKIKSNPELKSALTVLQDEFSAELNEYNLLGDRKKPIVNGLTWQPRHQYLVLYFSYGKGFDPALREKIKQIVADYAAVHLKSNSLAKDDSPSK